MRTITFREVFNRLVRLHGRDPQADVSSDMRNALVEHINQRVRVACMCWRWPEWELTEERAFRPIWNSTDQYLRVSVIDGTPDEVFYLGDSFVTGGSFGDNSGYYRVTGSATTDPPIGALPTDTTYWEVVDPVDTFIAYDQRCRRSIGMVNGIYSRNPRNPTGSGYGLLDYNPSEKGIDVRQPGNPTVFMNYKMPVPRYTMTPYVVGKTYQRADVIFDPNIGECFQALATTTALPADTFFWTRVPFLEHWSNYVCQGAFSDSLLEFDQGGGQDSDTKMKLAQMAESKANGFLDVEVDSLLAQGQKLQWNFCRKNSWWCCSQPFTGGTVSTLSEACQDSLGFVYPLPTLIPQVAWQYRTEIVSLRTTTPALNGLATRALLPHSLVQIIISLDSVRTPQLWELMTGAADTADPNGQVAPLDYNAQTNDKHWEQRT